MKNKLNKNEISLKAENFIANILQKDGWKILSKRYRGIGFEIDLIAYKKNVLKIVEVKARTQLNIDQNFVENLINENKKKSLIKGTFSFLNKNSIYYNDISFDLYIYLFNENLNFKKYYVFNNILNDHQYYNLL